MGLEDLQGFDGSEGMSESAFEAFKEQMKAAAAQIAAIKKEESKHKKKEEDLLKILLKFIKNSKKSKLVFLISKVLAENIPANFILAIILLGNPDIQKEVGSFLLPKEFALKEDETSSSKALIFFEKQTFLPLKARIEMDVWMKGLLFQAQENPFKLLKNSFGFDKYIYTSDFPQEKKIKKELINLVAYILEEYILSLNVENTTFSYQNFSKFVLKGILSKTKDFVESQKMIE